MDGFGAGIKKAMEMANTGFGMLRTQRLNPLALVNHKGVENPKQLQAMLKKAREIEARRKGCEA
jgi:quinone-modifying oxidoreductase subunit QmoC